MSGSLFVLSFLPVLLIIHFIVYYGCSGTSSKVADVLYYLIACLLIMSIVVGFCDIVYSFYIASQVYGQFDEFKQGVVNCSSAVYYSSFVSGIIVFSYFFVEIGVVVLLCLWFKIDLRGRVFC